MGRDLLYKPVVHYIPEEETSADDVKKGVKGKAGKTGASNKIGKTASKTLGTVGNTELKQSHAADGKKRAYKAAYFNKDTSGVRGPNFNQNKASALRGSKAATDLRQVVIPGSATVDHPEPGVLHGAASLMGLEEGFSEDMEGLLGRQGSWTQSKGMTVEQLEERMEELERMVDLRKAALGRMAEGRSDQPVTSVTILHAATSAGTGLDDVEDVAAAGTDLIQQTAAQGAGMHQRMAKMLGVKIE